MKPLNFHFFTKYFFHYLVSPIPQILGKRKVIYIQFRIPYTYSYYMQNSWEDGRESSALILLWFYYLPPERCWGLFFINGLQWEILLLNDVKRCSMKSSGNSASRKVFMNSLNPSKSIVWGREGGRWTGWGEGVEGRGGKREKK